MTTQNDAATGTANSGNGSAGDAGAGNAGTQGNTGAGANNDAAAVAAVKAAADAAAAKGNAGSGDERYGAPESYALPEGATFDTELADDLAKLGKQLNLSQKGMASVYDVANRRAQSVETTFKNAHEANMKEWNTQTGADKELGGEKLAENRAIAAKGLEHFATPELRTILKESGLENHPEFLRVFYRVGKAVSEDKFVRGGASQNAAASALFSYDKSDHQQQ